MSWTSWRRCAKPKRGCTSRSTANQPTKKSPPNWDLRATHLGQYREASRAPVSLDSPISTEDATTISEHVADANAAGPLDELVKHNDHELVREVLATLDQRESRILAMRFGLDDGQPKTLEEVGERLGVTRERIRQIQEQALDKMRVKIEKRDQPAPALLA